MFLLTWLHQRTTGRPPTRRAPARKPTPRCRLRIEVLETRDLPSALVVTNALDSGPGSLRAEIAAAKSHDTIDFAPGLDGQTITLTSGELAIGQNLTIDGPGAGLLTVSGGNASRIFEVDGAKTNVTLTGLTLTQGAGLGGGAIDNGGTLAVRDCTLSGNSAEGGGAIDNGGTATVQDSTLSGNSSVTSGGAIFNDVGGTLTVTHSTLSGNSAGLGEGGGAIWAAGTMTISQSTLSGNSAPFGGGGAIADVGVVTVNQCTLSGNSAEGGFGGAIAAFGGQGSSLTINQSTLSDNAADTAPNPFTGVVSVGLGGAIANVVPLTINQCVLSGNSASGGQGGALWNQDATVTIRQSTLSGNSASGGQGGAIYNSGFADIGTVTVFQSTVTGNSAATGGGIDNDVGGVLSVQHSSVVGNTAPAGAGADLYNAGSATLLDSLVFVIDGSGSLTF
jgi:hypothetical protein